jgi:predicted MFS family arabinose efflux permease
MSTDKPTARLSPLRLLQVTAFTSVLDRFAMPPMLIAIAHDMDVPLTQIVQAAGAYFLAYGLMQPVWGIVSDYLGLVRIMRITLALAVVATMVSALTWTPLTLGVARGVAGACFSAAVPATLIYLGDTVPAAGRQRAITHLLAGVAVGTALASVGAGVIAQLLTWRVTFVTTGLLALLLVVALRHLPEPHRVRAHHNAFAPLVLVVRSGPARLVLLLAFVEGGILLGVLTLLPAAVEATGVSSGVAGAVTAVYGVAVLGFARVVGSLSRRMHTSRLISLGAGAALGGCVLLSISQVPVVAVVVAVLLGLAWAAMHSSLQTWATEVLPGARATVVSLFASALFIGSAVSAVIVARPAEAEQYREIFAVAAVLVIPLGLLGARGRAVWHRPGGEGHRRGGDRPQPEGGLA